MEYANWYALLNKTASQVAPYIEENYNSLNYANNLLCAAFVEKWLRQEFYHLSQYL